MVDSFGRMLRGKEYVKAAACVASVILLLLTAWFASDVLLLAFAGILLAIILRTISDRLAVWMHLRAGLALGITCLLLLGAAAVSFWYIVPRLSDEGDVLK